MWHIILGCHIHVYVPLKSFIEHLLRPSNGAKVSLLKQVPDVEAWGEIFAVSPLVMGQGYELHVIARYLDTQLFIGSELVEISQNGGTFHYTASKDDHLFIEANKPILVLQTSVRSSKTESMLLSIVPAVESYLSKYSVPLPSPQMSAQTKTTIFLFVDSTTDKFLLNGRQLTALEKFEIKSDSEVQSFSFKVVVEEPFCDISSQNGHKFGLVIVRNDPQLLCEFAFSPFVPMKSHVRERRDDDNATTTTNQTRLPSIPPPTFVGTLPDQNASTTKPYTGEPAIRANKATSISRKKLGFIHFTVIFVVFFSM